MDFNKYPRGTLFILVGPMGCGKNYVGERLAKVLGCRFIDGDTFVPQAMIDKVSAFKPLGQKDIDDFVTQHLIPGIKAAYLPEESLVIAQALYRQEHRQQIRQELGDCCKFVLVQADLVMNLKRLLRRPKGLRWALYGLWNRLFFQPAGCDEHFDNNLDWKKLNNL